jgi:hypothetical protein
MVYRTFRFSENPISKNFYFNARTKQLDLSECLRDSYKKINKIANAAI